MENTLAVPVRGFFSFPRTEWRRGDGFVCVAAPARPREDWQHETECDSQGYLRGVGKSSAPVALAENLNLRARKALSLSPQFHPHTYALTFCRISILFTKPQTFLLRKHAHMSTVST